MSAILQLVNKMGWMVNMQGSAMTGLVNKIQYRNSLLALSLPILLTGCGLREVLAEVEATWSEPFRWIIKYWALSLIWVLPVPVLYGFLASGRYLTYWEPGTGTGLYGNPINVWMRRTGDWVEGNKAAGAWLASMWLILFPVGYALYPWYAPIWHSADYARITSYPNLNWHLVKWIFPLVVFSLAGALIAYVLSRQPSNRIARNLLKAGKAVMWLGVVWVVTPPAFAVVNHLFKRPEPELVAASAEPPARPLPTQPRGMKIPKNGEFDPYATQLWSCKRGFVQVGETCQSN
jgi:hypothetical protein